LLRWHQTDWAVIERIARAVLWDRTHGLYRLSCHKFESQMWFLFQRIDDIIQTSPGTQTPVSMQNTRKSNTWRRNCFSAQISRKLESAIISMEKLLKSVSFLTKYPVYNKALTFHYSVYLNNLNMCVYIKHQLLLWLLINCLKGTLKWVLKSNTYTVNMVTNIILWLFAHTLIYGSDKYFKMIFAAADRTKLF